MGARPRRPVSTPATRERRVDIRVTVDTYIRAAVVHGVSGKKLHGWVRNLSVGGLFVETPDRFGKEEPVHVDAMARNGETVVHLKFDGWVAYEGESGMGIQFGEVSAEMAERVSELLDRFG